MSIKRLLAPAALGASLLVAIAAAPSIAHAANPSSGTPPTVPQVAAATSGSAWLAGQLTPAGFIPVTGAPAQANLAATANAVLALASAGGISSATNALHYLSLHVNDYVSVGGSDGPGQLALLILDTHALGADPHSFGGSDLVSRLLATEQTSGPNVGLFGSQDATFDGAFRQGLSLSALGAAGVTGTTAVGTAEAWLAAQQCPDGGWTSLVTVDNPCNGDPANFAGPDTNSTAQAIQGLSAEGALTTKAARSAAKFLVSAQDPDAGWGFEPNAVDAPGSSDPDSTALVVQAILALGKSPTSTTFVQGGSTPVSTLLSFQLTSGPGSGGFFFPGSTDPDLLATYQSVPAVAGVTDPFNLVVTTALLPGGTVRSPYATTLVVSGGTAPYRWKLVAGAGTLPAGLRLNATSGTISGKPKTAGVSSFAVEVFATRSTSSPSTQAIGWKVFSITTSAAT
jgi:Putative Ig domain